MNHHRLQNFILLLVTFSIFTAPATWNGFPLIFTDSLTYLVSGIDLVAPVDKPIFYGLFIRISNLILDFWGLVIFQSALVIFLLLKLASSLFPNLSQRISLLWICLTGMMTSVPWFVGQISADIFTSCLFLTIIILALNCERASYGNIILLGGLMILNICMHSGNLMIGFTLFILMIGLLLLQKRSWSYIKKFSYISITSFAISIAAIVASNSIFHQGVTFNRWGKVIFLARILEDGPGLQYLNSVCTKEALKTCAALPLFNEAAKKEIDLRLTTTPELKNLVLNALLWDGGINAVGGLPIINNEASYIIRETIKTYPLSMANAFVNNSLDQLKVFSVGNQFGSTIHLTAINNFFLAHFPDSYQSYFSSHQSQGTVNIATNLVNLIYNVVVILSGFFIFVIIYLSFKSKFCQIAACKNSAVQLVIFSLIGFLISNAMITGGLSAVFDRYQSRVIWLLPAISLLFAIELMKQQYKRSYN
ncbi:hypothetical protein [Polynucleobacter sp. IMCC 29146]|uniref:hypothetical protein n=1 Tax=Polynucleobacter sp. IMCC 29146 TaxID=2780953 RepID=UPI001F1B9427|nr:hypothetical protein [Polynucleobacter sp. IMCC 29146]MCE7530519.1 hypothetical protein [Polynucleobacter sp. IMCC 29146]